MGYKPSQKIITGQLKLPTQGSSGGILMGGDVHLLRRSANTLELGAGDSLWLYYQGLIIRDTGIKILSSDDGHLDLQADISIDLNTPIVEIGIDKKLQFRDSTIFISSKSDGQLDLDADASISLNTSALICTGVTLDNGSIKKFVVTSDARTDEGAMKWDASAHKLQVYNGSAWETVTSA